MVSSEVQRTLVKSPPELWAEISDADALARHLGEFGEIRITRVQPEQKVEWEADEARGTVVIKPSGWGTKVKLTVERELTLEPRDSEGETAPELAIDTPVADDAAISGDAEAAADAEPTGDAEPAPDLEPAVHVEAEADEPDADEPEADDGPSAAELSADEPQLAAEPVVAEPEPEPRRGFFARLFGRRRAASPPLAPEPEPEPEGTLAIEREPISVTADALPAAELPDEPALDADAEAEAGAEAEAPTASEAPLAEPAETDDAGEQPDLAAELAAAEEIAAEQVTAVLTNVLDRLGAAHHRPFSRS